jgi:hypothetical protein
MGCTIQALIPSSDKRFLSKTLISTLGPMQPPVQWAPASFSPGLKWPGHAADHSPALVPMLRMCGTVTLLPLNAFMAWTGTALLLTIHNIMTVTMNTSEIRTTLMPHNANSWDFYVNRF